MTMITNYTIYYFINVTEDYEAEVNESIIVPSSVNSVVIRIKHMDYQFQVAATAEKNGEVLISSKINDASYNYVNCNYNIYVVKFPRPTLQWHVSQILI